VFNIRILDNGRLAPNYQHAYRSKELSIERIAEGVEDIGQAELLVSAGCHQVQGLYFAEPVRRSA